MVVGDVLTARDETSPMALEMLWRRHHHLVKYLLIGGSAVVIDLGLFLVLHHLADFGPLAAHSVSVPTSVVWSFLLNAFLNFRTTDRLGARFVSFATVAAIGFLVGAGVIELLHGRVALSADLAKVVSLPLVFAVQYLLNSRVSFRASRSSAVVR
jgi:putative flippase GtrA